MGGVTTGPNYFDVIDSLNEIINQLHQYVNSTDFTQNINVTEILDVCRSARHPSVSWAIDFVLPRPEMNEINEMIDIIDEKIFQSHDSILLKPNITADVYQLSAFHNIRANRRAEYGNINSAISIYKNFIKESYDKLDTSRKANLLYSYAISLLSNSQFIDSYKQYEELWYLLKYSSAESRLESGCLDAWVLLNQIYWFFIKHVEDFRFFMSSKFQLHNKDVWNHKKISFLNILNDDHTWLVSLMGIGFYNIACATMKDLPTYLQPSHYIPRNDRNYYSEERMPSASSAYSGLQQTYADKWNRQLLFQMTRSGEFNYYDCENYKYSFFFFENDFEKDKRQHNMLFEYTKKYINLSNCKSIIYAGCCLSPAKKEMESSGLHVTCVDISEQVAFEASQLGINTNVCAIEKFIEQNKADILFAPDVLSHIERNKYINLIKDAARNVKYFCALIETNEDIRTLQYEHLEKRCNLHKISESPVWYASVIRDHFENLGFYLSEDKKEVILICQNINLRN